MILIAILVKRLCRYGLGYAITAQTILDLSSDFSVATLPAGFSVTIYGYHTRYRPSNAIAVESRNEVSCFGEFLRKQSCEFQSMSLDCR